MASKQLNLEKYLRREDKYISLQGLGVTESSSTTINKVGKCRGTAYSFQEYLLPSQALCV